jgi:hypothetical protein
LPSNKIYLLLFHIILGLLLSIFPFLSTYYGLILIISGTYYILFHFKYSDYYPIYFSAYIVGIEVLLRTSGSQLFWEFGKYAVIYFMFLGIIRKKFNIYIHLPILFYFILLLPSILIVPYASLNVWRQDVAFNLSGPACLAISSIYLFNCKINSTGLKKIIFLMILPIVSLSAYNVYWMPDLDTYKFLPYSNFSTSGGYGPNQVSTLFGLGIICVLISKYLNFKIFGNKYLEFFSLILFFGLGLITFSRGGVLAAIIAFMISFSYNLFNNQKKVYMIVSSIGLLCATLISWYSIVSITDGVLSQRYGMSGVGYGKSLVLDLTGRALIYEIDLNIFKDNFFSGVGPGQATSLRYQYGYAKIVSAHTEYSRMLAEHGVLGLFSISCLIVSTISLSLGNKIENINVKFLKITFLALGLLTISHSAMRIAMPSFVIGLVFPRYKIK